MANRRGSIEHGKPTGEPPRLARSRDRASRLGSSRHAALCRFEQGVDIDPAQQAAHLETLRQFLGLGREER